MRSTVYETLSSASVQAHIDRLRGIPLSSRSFTIDRKSALDQYGFDSRMLTELVRLGLPYGGSLRNPRFAHLDLHYLGLHLGTARAYLHVIRLWRRSLERLAGEQEPRVRIQYLPQLSENAGTISGLVRLPGGRTQEVPLQHNRAAIRLDIALHATWPQLPADIVTILDEVGALDLCLFPPQHRGDSILARRFGLTDCWTAACLVIQGCKRSGYDARLAHGLMVSLPYSFEHVWAEVHVSGRWVPVDPVVVTTMHRFGTLDPCKWPHSRSIGAMLAHFDLTPTISLITHDHAAVPATYLTSML